MMTVERVRAISLAPPAGPNTETNDDQRATDVDDCSDQVRGHLSLQPGLIALVDSRTLGPMDLGVKPLFPVWFVL